MRLKLSIGDKYLGIKSGGSSRIIKFSNHSEMHTLLNLDIDNKIIELQKTKVEYISLNDYSTILGIQNQIDRLEKLKKRINKALDKTNNTNTRVVVTVEL